MTKKKKKKVCSNLCVRLFEHHGLVTFIFFLKNGSFLRNGFSDLCPMGTPRDINVRTMIVRKQNAVFQFNILPSYHACPNIGDCPENRIYYDGCCEQCNNTGIITLEKESHSLCAPESLPSNQTVGLVTEDSPFHDTCANAEAIVGFTECRGLCDSYTYFNKSKSPRDVRVLFNYDDKNRFVMDFSFLSPQRR